MNFITDQWNHGYKTMLQECTQNILKGDLLLLKDLIRTLKSKICKYITSILKNVYTSKVHYIGNKYNNTYHSTIKMKPLDVQWNIYIDCSKKLMIKILDLKLVALLENQNKNYVCKGQCSKLMWISFCD